ncbi:MAG: hypothetical protein RL033_746, partial [Pseudomonadota bacterium]
AGSVGAALTSTGTSRADSAGFSTASF